VPHRLRDPSRRPRPFSERWSHVPLLRRHRCLMRSGCRRWKRIPASRCRRASCSNCGRRRRSRPAPSRSWSRQSRLRRLRRPRGLRVRARRDVRRTPAVRRVQRVRDNRVPRGPQHPGGLPRRPRPHSPPLHSPPRRAPHPLQRPPPSPHRDRRPLSSATCAADRPTRRVHRPARQARVNRPPPRHRLPDRPKRDLRRKAGPSRLPARLHGRPKALRRVLGSSSRIGPTRTA